MVDTECILMYKARWHTHTCTHAHTHAAFFSVLIRENYLCIKCVLCLFDFSIVDNGHV